MYVNVCKMYVNIQIFGPILTYASQNVFGKNSDLVVGGAATHSAPSRTARRWHLVT